MGHLAKLTELRSKLKNAHTTGLCAETIKRFLAHDASLRLAVDRAHTRYHQNEWQNFMHTAPEREDEQIAYLQQRIFNFYQDNALNPYIPLAGAGAWIITSFGAVLHDSGGYGMLGLGHGVEDIEHIVGKSYVMANIMTASISQRKIRKALDNEIGQTRKEQKVYGCYMFLNSGSEAVTLASRIVDVNTKLRIGSQQRVTSLINNCSFHGRTERPARLSDICLGAYQRNLHSFKNHADVTSVPHNDMEALRAIFQQAERENFFIDAIYLEPVTGEGDPGRAITPAYYELAHQLTEKHGSLLIIDSVQAGIRAHGVLSVVDYPAFQQLPPPDVEVFSKALHSGHIPLSAAAVTERIAALFPAGLHGNTMTANPRSLEVGYYTLTQLTPDIRQNIVARGQEFLDELHTLQQEFPQVITKVQGTGLLFCLGITDEIPVVGQVEESLRKRGLGVIHGDNNVLRFTPHFRITSAEVNLVISILREELLTLSTGNIKDI